MIHIRWMIRRDLPEVLRMSLVAEEDLCKELREKDRIGMVATEGFEGPIVGWMIYQLQPGKLDLLQIDAREWSVQEALVHKLMGKLGPGKTRDAIAVKVPLDGEEAEWWKQQGFQLTSFDSQADELSMTFRLKSEVAVV